jgi:hypothetical protein
MDIICICNPPYQGNGFDCLLSDEVGPTAGTGSDAPPVNEDNACSGCGDGARCVTLGADLNECFRGTFKVPITETCS